MKTTKRILSVILTLLMLFGTVSATIIPASAEESKYGYLSYEIIDNEVTITDCDENASGTITIPSKINGYPVTCIGNNAFFYCSRLTNITLPSSVMSIGKSAFENCTALETIELPQNLITLGACAFKDCAVLKNIAWSSNIINIGYDSIKGTSYYNNKANWDGIVLYADKYLIDVQRVEKQITNQYGDVFTENAGLLKGKYNIKAGTKVIACAALSYCDQLTDISIPSSVVSINMNAFYSCTSLKNISFSEGLKEIGRLFVESGYFDGLGAFFMCSAIEEINLPDSLEYIGYDTFCWCKNLRKVKIGNNVKCIENLAFYNCNSLKEISVPQNVLSIGNKAFGYSSGYAFGYEEIDEIKNPNFKIYCYAGTAGEQYAIDNGFDYELINDEPQTYSVTYNANGGLGAPAQQTKTQDIALTLSSAVPTREGYKFLGWAENQNAVSAQYKSGASFTKNADTTLYAVWSPVSYTVKFFDGANLLGSKTLKYGETGTLSYGAVPSKSGFKFTGWSTFEGGVATLKNGQEIKNLSSVDGAVISYYAAWKAVENKTVTDGATGVSITASEDTYNGNMTLKVEKVLSGSSFDILETVDDVVEKSEVFSIETYVDGVKTQPNGYVTVKIPVPSGFNKTKCELYYINTATKKAEPISFTFEGIYIVFKTNHFSDWAIVQTAGKVKSVKVDNITLNYKKSAVLKPQITADSGVKYTVTYESSNTKVATVDKDGKVYAAKKGAADIKVTVTDEYGNKVSDTCKVTVKYSFGQWLIIILLFGWIWY